LQLKVIEEEDGSMDNEEARKNKGNYQLSS
jgi:hypothetical protein